MEDEEEAEVKEEAKEKGERERKREKDGAVNRRRRVPIRGLYSRGMSYMPPAVADALFIARLFIISSSYTYVAESALETRSPAQRGDGVARSCSFILARVPPNIFLFVTIRNETT